MSSQVFSDWISVLLVAGVPLVSMPHLTSATPPVMRSIFLALSVDYALSLLTCGRARNGSP